MVLTRTCHHGLPLPLLFMFAAGCATEPDLCDGTDQAECARDEGKGDDPAGDPGPGGCFPIIGSPTSYLGDNAGVIYGSVYAPDGRPASGAILEFTPQSFDVGSSLFQRFADERGSYSVRLSAQPHFAVVYWQGLCLGTTVYVSTNSMRVQLRIVALPGGGYGVVTGG